MYSKEFESKIKRYVGNGNISPQQREELHEEAEEYKIDDEELDIVIDGYIYPNDVKTGNTSENLGATAFNNLDPSEVESISVLKDAASAAVYGLAVYALAVYLIANQHNIERAVGLNVVKSQWLKRIQKL